MAAGGCKWKRLILLLSVIVVLTACSVLNRTYVQDYGEQIELVKTHFPEIYDLYRQGSVIIEDVYTYEENGKKRVGVHYRYR